MIDFYERITLDVLNHYTYQAASCISGPVHNRKLLCCILYDNDHKQPDSVMRNDGHGPASMMEVASATNTDETK